MTMKVEMAWKMMLVEDVDAEADTVDAVEEADQGKAEDMPLVAEVMMPQVKENSWLKRKILI